MRFLNSKALHMEDILFFFLFLYYPGISHSPSTYTRAWSSWIKWLLDYKTLRKHLPRWGYGVGARRSHGGVLTCGDEFLQGVLMRGLEESFAASCSHISESPSSAGPPRA